MSILERCGHCMFITLSTWPIYFLSFPFSLCIRSIRKLFYTSTTVFVLNMILNIFIWCSLVFVQERSRSNLLFVFIISQISVIFLQVIPLSRITCASNSCCSCWVAFLNMMAALLLWSFCCFSLKFSFSPISFLKKRGPDSIQHTLLCGVEWWFSVAAQWCSLFCSSFIS